jgi:tetratricopeptide (TPR) repeat protein
MPLISPWYKATYEQSSLANAIKHYKQGLECHPMDEVHHGPLLNNLGVVLHTRYEQLGDMKDLDQAIVCNQQALDLHPPGHPVHSSSLNNLGNALIIRYHHLEHMKDLDQTIVYYWQALDLCPPGHPDHSMSLYNIGNASRSSFLHSGNLSDMMSATESFKDALSLLSPNHPCHGHILTAQASLQQDIHQSKWVQCTNYSHIRDACVLFESATNHLSSGLLSRFKASKDWVQAAHENNLDSVITAYSNALQLQHQHLVLLPSVSHQKKFIETSPTLALNAASCAIAANDIPAAVVFLEQG